MHRRISLSAIFVAIVALLLTVTAGAAFAVTQTDSLYSDGFTDLSGLDATQTGNTALFSPAGVQLLTLKVAGPSTTWNTMADFSAPAPPRGPVVGLSTLDAAAMPGSLTLPFTPLAFRRAQAEPVLSASAPVSGDGFSVAGPCVRRVGTTYYMWYTGVPEDRYAQRIFLATSTDGKTWTRAGDAVLDLGKAGTYDARQASRPWVVYDKANAVAPFRMWYSAEGASGSVIGYATSKDGMAWTKGGKVLAPGSAGAIDAGGVSQPSVLIENGIYKMWYTAAGGGTTRIAYATSKDGKSWSKVGASFPVGSGNVAAGAWAPCVYKLGNAYRMIVTGGVMNGGALQAKLLSATGNGGQTWSLGGSVLSPGSGSDFDAFSLSQASVIPATSGKAGSRLWYTGSGPDVGGFTHQRIGLATTGRNGKWSKTAGGAGAPFYKSVMTLGAQSAAFDSMSVADLRLAAASGTTYAFYAGTKGSDLKPRIGVRQTTDRREFADVLPGGAPLIDAGVSGFDAGGVTCPAPVFTGAAWLVYHTALSASGEASIGLHSGADLGSLARVGSGAVLARTGAGFEAAGCADPFAVGVGSTVSLFYAAENGSGVWSIGRATANVATPGNLNGRAQVLAPTADGYDAGGLRKPIVVPGAGPDWQLWYTAIDSDGVQRLAYATSANAGATWTKRGLAMNLASGAYDIAEKGFTPTSVATGASGADLFFTGADRYGWARVGVASAAGPGYVDAGAATYEFGIAPGQEWRQIRWRGPAVPIGSGLQVAVSAFSASGNAWSAYKQVADGSELGFGADVTKIRWRVAMTATDPAVTPQLDDLTVNHAPDQYPAAGTAVTVPVGPAADRQLVAWGDATINATVPEDASATVTVRDAWGATIMPAQPLASGATAIALAAVPVTSGPLVLAFDLAGDGSVTPRLDGLSVSYTSVPTESTLTLTATPVSMVFGGVAQVSGMLTLSGAPVVPDGLSVAIKARDLKDATYTDLGTVPVGADGSFVLPAPVSPAGSTMYVGEWVGGSVDAHLYQPAAAGVRVDVKAKIGAAVSGFKKRRGSTYLYPLGRKVTVKGAVTPNHHYLEGTPTLGKVTVTIYRWQYSSSLHKKTWMKVASSKRTIATTGKYSWSWKPKKVGSYRLNARFAGDVNHLTCVSAYRKVKVY